MILAIGDLFIDFNHLLIFCLWNASQFMSCVAGKRSAKFFFSPRFRSRAVKQKTPSFILLKKRGFIFL